MQKAIPYKPQLTAAAGDGQGGKVDGANVNIQRVVMENPVIVFGRRDCCMCHVITRLLLGLGANPTLYEVGEEDEAALVAELSTMIKDCKDSSSSSSNNNNNSSCSDMQFPAVFVGGKLFGGLDRVMATHISGELVPILKEAGALWL